MDTLPVTPGSPGIIVQNVTAYSMQVNVNGEIKEIKNSLEELKALLQKASAENFKSGDKIYK